MINHNALHALFTFFSYFSIACRHFLNQENGCLWAPTYQQRKQTYPLHCGRPFCFKALSPKTLIRYLHSLSLSKSLGPGLKREAKNPRLGRSGQGTTVNNVPEKSGKFNLKQNDIKMDKANCDQYWCIALSFTIQPNYL